MNIWRTDIENDEYKLKSLRASDIEEAEKFFNVKLPVEYINILQEQNGGYIIFNSHPSPVPTSWSENSVNIDFIMGISKKAGVFETPYLIKEWDLPIGIIVISGDGHAFIALDYRENNFDPKVIYIDIDMAQVVTIANNFKVFLNNLYTE